MSLLALAPERYAGLDHPGDAYALGLFAEVGVALRNALPALHGISAEHVLAVGASQSAMYLTTFVNAVDPLGGPSGAFDGYLLQGRGGAGVPIEGWDPASIRLRHDDDHAARRARLSGADRIRADARVPVIVVQSETDVFGSLRYLPARQDDSERFRLWEVAGAAHCDTYFLHASPHDDGTLDAAELAAHLAHTDLGVEGTRPMNDGPQMHYVLQRALDALDRWVRNGTPPSAAPRLEVDPAGRLLVDAHGIAHGGIRTPWVDAPVAVASGLGQAGVLHELMGTSRRFGAAELAERWPGGAEEHAAAHTAATDAAIDAGFLTPADRAEILALGRGAWPTEPDVDVTSSGRVRPDQEVRGP
jgi:hypothetical protein